MEVQHKNIPTPEEIEQKREEAHVPKDEIALMQEKNELPPESEETPKLSSELSEERKKELEVPKDEMAMIEEKMSNEKEGEKCSVLREKEDKEVSSNCEKELDPIKEEKGCDLLDFDIEPLRIEPKLDSTASQEEFRKQVYMENEKDRKHHLEEHHEVQRKEEIKEEEGERIMKEMKKSDNKGVGEANKEKAKNKEANKNKAINEKEKGEHRKENKV